MKIKWLINPFERIAGWQALAIGVAVMALTAITGKLNRVTFDGALDVHGGATFSLSAAFAMQAIDFLSLSTVMLVAGIIFSRSRIRIIDVAGTVSLARTPLLLLTVICFLPVVPDGLFDFPRLIVFLTITVPLCIWMVALMYHAYSVSCRLKGSRAVISFIGALATAEIVSKCIFCILLSSLFANPPVSNISGAGSAENVAITVVDSLTVRQKAISVAQAFERNDFDAVTACFDNNMKKALPASGLKMVWIQTLMTAGAFQKADCENIREFPYKDSMTVVIVPLSFKNGLLNLQIAFNKDGTVGGLYIKPEK